MVNGSTSAGGERSNMAERAHPEDPAYQESGYEKYLYERYAFCQPYVVKKRVLDVPVGTGWGASILRDCSILVGLDLAYEAVSYGKEHYPGIHFAAGSMPFLPFGDGSFDVILCLEGFEHVYFQEAVRFLAEARRVLVPGGLLIMTIPLLKNGRHSGNPYHTFEYEEESLQSIFEDGFQAGHVDRLEGPDGPVLRWVGRSEGQTSDQSPLPPSEPRFFTMARSWLETLREEPGFRFSAKSPVTLLSTSMAILLAEGIGSLGDISPEEKDRWASYLRSCQDKASGLFIDPLLKENPPAAGVHDEEYLRLQMTYFAVQALDALGVRPLHPLSFLQPFYEEGHLEAWLDGLDWSNPWLESNRVMFILAGLVARADWDQDRQAVRLVYRALDWLNRHQDPATGLWGTDRGAATLCAAAAAYHFIPFYEYARRPIPAMKKIVDSVLSLQQDDGLFGNGRGGGACEDEDAIELLAVITRTIRYRAGDIKKALVRAFWALWNRQNPDGGFGYSGQQPPVPYSFSSWKPTSANTSESDLWSTWFRLTAMATIQAACPGDLPDLGEWTFRRWPALGYHRRDRSVDAEERRRMSLWAFADLPERDLDGETPEISIVIPYCNMGVYLPETLRSLMNQTTQRGMEIIIVDDGSTDEYSRLVLDYLNRPGLHVLRQENRGVAAARNAGIRQARGRLICCIDPDDCYAPDYLEKAASALDSDPEAGIVATPYELFDEERGLVRAERCNFPEMLVENQIMVAAMFRREGWEKAGGYDESLPSMQDWEFWINVLEQGYRAVALPEVGFYYRVRADSMYQTTRQPERFSALYSQYVRKHRDTYLAWFEEVTRLSAWKFAYLAGEIDRLNECVRRQERLYREAAARREIALELENELRSEIASQARMYAELSAWLKEVEVARDWHNNERARWEATAKQLDQQVADLSARLRNLEEENAGLRARLDRSASRLKKMRNRLNRNRWVRLRYRLRLIKPDEDHQGGGND